MANAPAPAAKGSPSIDAPAPRDESLPRAFGRLWLLKRVARGGMGEVYLASTTGIEGAERPCVVKIIRREHAQDRSFLARFLDEARVQAQLHHPGVAQILEAATDADGEPYVVVEHVEGRSLGEVRSRAVSVGLRIGWADATAIAAALAEGLSHVHERVDAQGRPLGIVHRDLSPQNVMVSYAGDLKLIDFGTARGENRRCHTIAGVVFAKPGYVAPEVANQDPGDHRVDLYALGVILWELLAGRRFLQGDATEHLAAVARNERTPPPIAQLVGAPAALDAIIAQLVAHDRATRYASARAAAADLVKVLAAADSLPGGERGVRPRIARLMSVLYPSEPARTRSEFASLVAEVRARKLATAPASRVRSAPPPEAAPEPIDDGRLAGTPYRLVQKLGEGATGEVWEAAHIELDRRVALKVMSAAQATSVEDTARFRREARVIASLHEATIPTVHDFGQSADGRLFCAMELLEGETLDARLARETRLEWRTAVHLAMQALGALSAAHAAGLVHRDVKPANLFLERGGGLKVLDFGLARVRGQTAEARRAPVGGVSIVGTPEYVAPEQARGGVVDARADLYALGVVLYEMCTGERPFRGAGVEVIDAKSRAPARPLRELAPDVPRALERAISKALSPHAVDRFVGAVEMRTALARVLADADRARVVRRRVATFAPLALLAAVAVAGASRSPKVAFAWHRAVAALAPARAPATPPAPALELAPAAPAAIAPAAPAPRVIVLDEPAVPAEPLVLLPPPPADEPPASIAAPPVDVAALSLAEARQRAKAHRHDPAALRAWTLAASSTHAWDEARRAAEAWRFVEPGPEPELALARALVASGRAPSAVALLEDVVEKRPACDEARALLRELAPEPAARPAQKKRTRLARNDAR